jgi:VanZ family protein
MSDFERLFGLQLIAILLVATIALAAALAVRHQRPWTRFRLAPAATCLALGSGLAIAIATLTPRGDATSPGRIELMPLHTLRFYRFADNFGPYSGRVQSDLLVYVVGNIALFVPLGFFLYLAVRRRFALVVLAGALTSVAVEILQLPIWSRSTDIDDVLTNATGGFLGALAAVLVLQFFRPRAVQEPEPEMTYAVGSRAS